MAVISKIRNRAGILVAVVIGFALVAFILGDFLSPGGGSRFNPAKEQVAKVNGKGISYELFIKNVSELEELNKMQSQNASLDNETAEQIRNQVWEELVQERIMDREISKLGLSVHGDELDDMIRGETPHPFVAQFFTNPETNQINRAALYNFLDRIMEEGDNQDKLFWLYLEQQIYRQQLITKYNNLIRKGLYATAVDAEKRNTEQGKTVDFSYILKRYTDISDSLVSISESDIKKYYNDHIEEYKQDESRDIRFVTYTVVPSEKDYSDAEAWINDILPEYKTLNGEDTEQYVNLNSSDRFEPKNYAENELPEVIDSFAFSSNVGEIYGPYFEEERYKIAKLAAINYLPDSVRARHILLQADQSNAAQMQYLADSLKNLVENGSASLSELALIHSNDNGTRADGGDLGWFPEGQMVKPFNDSCFYGKKGDVKIVYTQFGIHIVEITDQSRPVKKVQVGYLTREVTASSQTDQLYYNKASEFAGINNTLEKFNEAVNNNSEINEQRANNLEPLAKTVGSLTDARNIVLWAFNAKLNEVSKVLQVDNNYVVVLLTGIHEKGYAPLEDLTAEIEIKLRNQKKGELFIQEIGETVANNNSIDAIAAELELPVENATNVRFTSYSIPGIGPENKVIGLATSLEEGTLSKPVAGENGVFIIEIGAATTLNQNIDIQSQQSMIRRAFDNKANYMSLQVLRELANVEDYRVNLGM